MSASTFERSLKWTAIALASAFAILFLVLAYMRLVYPYEVEWMEGAMLDHSIRMLAGMPIYTTPTIDFVPWLYPPLYYVLIAGAMKLFGISFFAGRIVSVLSTLLTGALLGWIVRRITRRNIYAYLTFAFYLATYHATGFYFDIARNDAFFTLLVVSSVWATFAFKGMPGAIACGVILALAFLTKQQAVFFFPALAIWFWMRLKRDSLVFAGVAVGLSLVVLLCWNSASDGWLFYYLFHIPSAKGAEFSWLRTLDVFPQYVFGVFGVSSVGAAGLLIIRYRSNRSDRTDWSTPDSLLTLMAVSGMFAGAISLGNEGGYANVMMPFAAFVVTMLPLTIHEIETGWPKRACAAWLAMLFQFAALYFNPLSEKMLIASAHQRAGGDEFMQKLRSMQGEVYIPYHGFIGRMAGKPSHANILATLDVLRMHDTTARRLQADLDSAFAQHRFGAVILEECPLIPCDSMAHYALSGRMIVEPNVMITRFGSEGTRPEFVFVPK